MTAELVRVTTELKLVSTLDCHVSNKHTLIAALHKIGAACGASAGEVQQVIDLFERWQRDDFTKQLLRRGLLRGKIAEQASFDQWRLPTFYEAKHSQLPVWANDLRCKVERRDGQLVLADVGYRGVPYADIAQALGVSSEQPVNGARVRMTLARVHESRCFDQGMALPLSPLMAVLNWFFEEPRVCMTEDERQHYATEQGMVLNGTELEPWQDESDVAPYGDSLDYEWDLAKYLNRRFAANLDHRRIDFANGTDSTSPERRHPYLWGDGFWMDIDLVHPTAKDVKVGFPGVSAESYARGDGSYLLSFRSPWHEYWDSSDYIEDVAVAEVTFGFSSPPPHTLAQKAELQQFTEAFTAKLHEHFEPAMQELQNPLPDE